MVKSQEAFNFYSHLAGMLAAAIGTFFLMARAGHSGSLLVTASVYGLSVVFLFLASSLTTPSKSRKTSYRSGAGWIALPFSS